MIKQVPLTLENFGKRDVRSQFAALCFRVKQGKTEILMITSRGSGRWIIPKGWPMQSKTPGETALIEAWEEAGVQGKVYNQCLGVFSYLKFFDKDDDAPCVAMVYPVLVKSLSKTYPEMNERTRKWMRPKRAAEKVDEPELAALLRQFDPKLIVKK